MWPDLLPHWASEDETFLALKENIPVLLLDGTLLALINGNCFLNCFVFSD